MMKRRLIIFLVLLILGIGGVSFAYLRQPKIILADSVNGEIKPYAQKLVKALNLQSAGQLFGTKYILYTANFEKKSYIPVLQKSNRKSILWLGSTQNYIPDLQNFDFIFTSTPMLNDFLNASGDKSYYLPLFTDTMQIKKKKGAFFALIGNPPFIEDILKENSLSYRKYELSDSNNLLDDMKKIRAVFAEKTALSEVSIDLHPVFLTLAAQKIPLVTNWDYAKPDETLNLYNNNVNFYMNKNDAKILALKLLQNPRSLDISKRVKAAQDLVFKEFSLDKSVNIVSSVLDSNEVPYYPAYDNSVNFDLPVSVGESSNGDFWLANDLEDYFLQKNYTTYLTFLNSLYKYQTAVNILMRGDLDTPTDKIGDINIYYLIHPQMSDETPVKLIENKEAYYDKAETMMAEYDAVAVASESLADALSKRGINAYYVPQFTNTKRFYPAYDETVKSDVLFVGRNAPYRRAAKIALDNNLPVTIYGPDWADLAKGEYVYNQELNKYYSSAKIVLNDTRREMLVHGVISNRIFDATACGTLVISDYMPEIEAVYGDSVPMWKTEKELINLIKYYLDPAHEEERLEKAKRAQKITLENFTAEQAVKKLEDIIQTLKQNGKAYE